MVDQNLREEAHAAVLQAIIKTAAKLGNSPAGVRELAEAYALLERDVAPYQAVVHNRS